MYIEGTAYGYNNNGNDLYNMFGFSLLSPGLDDINNLSTLTGQNGSIVADKSYDYLPNSLPNNWVGEIDSNGGTIIFKCDNDKGRGVTCEGQSGNYRALHSSVLFGAVRNETARNELMKIYMDYLLGITPCVEEQSNSFNVNSLSFSPGFAKQSGRLSFILIRPAHVTIDFYTIAGRQICRFINAKLHEGSYQLNLQEMLSSGRYIVQFEADKEVVNKLINITR